MKPVVIVHGGAGRVPVERRPIHAQGCLEAARVGYAELDAGKSALDAVVAAVRHLEDVPHFNAGTGAALTASSTLEFDASVMEGKDLRAGAVACLPPFRHPIDIARAVMEEGTHVLYCAEGAARFAIERGFVAADPDEMITDVARDKLARYLRDRGDPGWAGDTVGAVALDQSGLVAAATSTGGTVGKRTGRVGDSPILGAGSFAANELGACSTTGIGEEIMRFGLARYACDLLVDEMPAQEAADKAIAAYGDRIAGRGGLILIDPRGGAGVARNTESMSYAVVAGVIERSGY